MTQSNAGDNIGAYLYVLNQPEPVTGNNIIMTTSENILWNGGNLALTDQTIFKNRAYKKPEFRSELYDIGALVLVRPKENEYNPDACAEMAFGEMEWPEILEAHIISREEWYNGKNIFLTDMVDYEMQMEEETHSIKQKREEHLQLARMYQQKATQAERQRQRVIASIPRPSIEEAMLRCLGGEYVLPEPYVRNQTTQNDKPEEQSGVFDAQEDKEVGTIYEAEIVEDSQDTIVVSAEIVEESSDAQVEVVDDIEEFDQSTIDEEAYAISR